MAESDLLTLLKTLEIKRHEGIWRFETIDRETSSWAELVSMRSARDIAMLFMEQEGPTVILRAEDDTPADNRWVWLELSVYSDLQAVGFLAKIAEALAAVNVPCNAVAAFYHDHIFVPFEKADTALFALGKLTSESQ